MILLIRSLVMAVSLSLIISSSAEFSDGSWTPIFILTFFREKKSSSAQIILLDVRVLA